MVKERRYDRLLSEGRVGALTWHELEMMNTWSVST